MRISLKLGTYLAPAYDNVRYDSVENALKCRQQCQQNAKMIELFSWQQTQARCIFPPSLPSLRMET